MASKIILSRSKRPKNDREMFLLIPKIRTGIKIITTASINNKLIITQNKIKVNKINKKRKKNWKIKIIKSKINITNF